MAIKRNILSKTICNIITPSNSELPARTLSYYRALNFAYLVLTLCFMISHLSLYILTEGFHIEAVICSNAFGILCIILYFVKKRQSSQCFWAIFLASSLIPILGFYNNQLLMASMVIPIVSNIFALGQNNRKSILLMSIGNFFMYFAVFKPRFINSIQSKSTISDVVSTLESSINVIPFCQAMGIIFAFFLLRALEQQNMINSIVMEEKQNVDKKLQKSVQSLEHLVLSFSHELNNPLHTLLSHLDDIKGSLPMQGQMESKVKECLSCAHQLHCLISNVLDIPKIEQNAIDLKYTDVNPKKYFKNLWDSSKLTVESKGLSGHIEVQGLQMDKKLQMDTQRVKQIFMNLINNAVKFTQSGHVEVSVRSYSKVTQERILYEPTIPFQSPSYSDSMLLLSENYDSSGIQNHQYNQNRPILYEKGSLSNLNDIEIEDTSIGDPQLLRIEVVDSGAGISPGALEKIFERPDKKKNQDRSRLRLGMSLYVTKQLVDAMNGKILITSEQNLGTSVIVILPVNKINIMPKLIAHKMANLGNCQSLTSLVVEDIPFNAEINKKYLVDSGVEVLDWVQNGQEGINKYKQLHQRGKRVDIICMDIEMPVLNGKEAVRCIREYEKEQNMKPCIIIFLSGNCLQKEIQECLDKNGQIRGDFFLRKPISQVEFYELIKKLQK